MIRVPLPACRKCIGSSRLVAGLSPAHTLLLPGSFDLVCQFPTTVSVVGFNPRVLQREKEAPRQSSHTLVEGEPVVSVPRKGPEKQSVGIASHDIVRPPLPLQH